MIKYRLECKDCEITFDSWFASSKEYEKLKKNFLLNCYNCDSPKVKKSLMAPKLINSKNKPKDNLDIVKYDNIKKNIKSYQKFIQDNFKNVGENFAYEARSIHYNMRNKTKGIYGNVSQQDLKELKEEGIETQMIPWIDDTDN